MTYASPLNYEANKSHAVDALSPAAVADESAAPKLSIIVVFRRRNRSLTTPHQALVRPFARVLKQDGVDAHVTPVSSHSHRQNCRVAKTLARCHMPNNKRTSDPAITTHQDPSAAFDPAAQRRNASIKLPRQPTPHGTTTPAPRARRAYLTRSSSDRSFPPVGTYPRYHHPHWMTRNASIKPSRRAPPRQDPGAA